MMNAIQKAIKKMHSNITSNINTIVDKIVFLEVLPCLAERILSFPKNIKTIPMKIDIIEIVRKIDFRSKKSDASKMYECNMDNNIGKKRISNNIPNIKWK